MHIPWRLLFRGNFFKCVCMQTNALKSSNALEKLFLSTANTHYMGNESLAYLWRRLELLWKEPSCYLGVFCACYVSIRDVALLHCRLHFYGDLIAKSHSELAAQYVVMQNHTTSFAQCSGNNWVLKIYSNYSLAIENFYKLILTIAQLHRNLLLVFDF